jgi:hypothetical protein
MKNSVGNHNGINAMQTESVGDEIFKGPGKHEHEL